MNRQLHPRPDFRQSLCHTLLVAAFVLLGVLNPFSRDFEEAFHMGMMVVLVIAVTLSWSVYARRWLRWREVPHEVKVVQYQMARLDKERARSHALMSALALLLTGFAFLGRATVPEMSGSLFDEVVFFIAILIAVFSTAVLSRAISDLLARRRVRRSEEVSGE